jgi:chromosome segregation ATPase
MKEQLEERLEKLRAEFETGQAMSTDLERRQAQIRSSLLRISGAIQVLEELLREEQAMPQPSQFVVAEPQPEAAPA